MLEIDIFGTILLIYIFLAIGNCKGAVIFKAGYRGGRIFGGVPKYFASFSWGIKNLAKITKYIMGCEIFGEYV